MSNLKTFLDDLISTSNFAPSDDAIVGTRRKRKGNDKDAFITGAPGNKDKKKNKKKISLLGDYLQSRRIPLMRSGKAIFTPAFTEDDK